MLIQNLDCFEEINNIDGIQGGASARTLAATRARRGFGQGEARAEAQGDFKTYARTTTGGRATPDTGFGTASAAAFGVDKNGNLAASFGASLSIA